MKRVIHALIIIRSVGTVMSGAIVAAIPENET